MQPGELLVIARTLRDLHGPAAKRSAISRAYYFAFHSLRVWLVGENIRIRESGGGHEDVTNALWYSKHNHLRGISRAVQSLRTSRLGADYRLSRTEFESHSNAVAAVEIAEALMEDLAAFRSLPLEEQRTAIEVMRTAMGLTQPPR
jgi:uncharacterized protein (UPF0332 family)